MRPPCIGPKSSRNYLQIRVVQRWLHLKERNRGYDEATMVGNLVVLNAVGGDCVDDLEHLRKDEGLGAWRRCWAIRSLLRGQRGAS
jgi:hypothetical protein